MEGLIKRILKLPLDERNSIIQEAGSIAKKIAKLNIKKMIHKRPGPVANLVKDDIKIFITKLKIAIPEAHNLPNDFTHQYNLIIKPLNKRLVNLSR